MANNISAHRNSKSENPVARAESPPTETTLYLTNNTPAHQIFKSCPVNWNFQRSGRSNVVVSVLSFFGMNISSFLANSLPSIIVTKSMLPPLNSTISRLWREKTDINTCVVQWLATTAIVLCCCCALIKHGHRQCSISVSVPYFTFNRARLLVITNIYRTARSVQVHNSR